MRLETRLQAFAWELAPWLDTRAAPAFVYVLATGMSPRRSRIWSMRAVRVDERGNSALFSELINPGVAVPPEVAHADGATAEEIARSEPFDVVRPRLDTFFAGSRVLSVDPAGRDARLLALEYLRDPCTHEATGTARTPDLPDLARPGPGRALLERARGPLAAGLGLEWWCRPGHCARGCREGRAA